MLASNFDVKIMGNHIKKLFLANPRELPFMPLPVSKAGSQYLYKYTHNPNRDIVPKGTEAYTVTTESV